MQKQKTGTIGIYKITNPSGKIYIGQSTNIYSRYKIYRNVPNKAQPKIINKPPIGVIGPKNLRFVFKTS